MKRLLFSLALIAMGFCANAQDVIEGSFENLAKLTKGTITYDFSKAQCTKKGLEVSALMESDWKKGLPKEKKYCTGSINDDMKGLLVVGEVEDPQFNMSLQVLTIAKDMEKPTCNVVFTSTEDNSVLLKFGPVKNEDFNELGHDIGGYIKKNLKKVRKEQ